jgi:hypothetical protein
MRLHPKKSDLVFLVLVVAVVVFVTLLPSPRDNNPPVPPDFVHRGIKLEKDCLACHVKGGQKPMAARHPKRQDCFRCHREMKSRV